MSVGSLLFSFSGRVAKMPFAIAVVLVYLVSFLSQMLMSAPVTYRVGLWPFAFVQALLIWTWTALHIKRLRDANKSFGFAIAIACLYSLAVVILLIVLMMITASDASSETLRTGQGLIRIFLVLYLFAALFNSAEFGVLAFWFLGFITVLLLPVAIGVGFSIWAGTLQSMPTPARERSAA